MNAHQWLELVIYLGALALVTKPLGIYLGRVFDANGRTWLDPVMRPLEKLTYWIFRVDPKKEQGWKQYTFAMLFFSSGELVVHLRNFAAAKFSAAESARTRRTFAASGVQHRRQLRHKHELAELRGRKHDVVSLADGRADNP